MFAAAPIDAARCATVPARPERTMLAPLENPMQKPSPARKDVPPPQGPSTREPVRTEKQKAEAAEVAGRHRNSGQKDHKGAR